MSIKGPKPEQMTVAWFQKLPDHPRQRNTEKHARRARKKHLSTPFATQSVVSVVRYKGTWYKVDGHTRALLWKGTTLKAPHRVTAMRYECDTRGEFNQLYIAHNNKNAAESNSDLAYGRLRELGMIDIKPTLASQAANVSRLIFRLQTGTESFPDGMHFEAMMTWLPQYRHFNTGVINKKRRKTHSAFTIAEFITHRKYGPAKSDAFWDKFHAQEGNRLEGESDAVDALMRVHDRRKLHGISQRGSRGASNTITLIGLALRYFEGFRKDKRYKRPSVVLRNPKMAYSYVQKEFGRIELPTDGFVPVNAVKGAEIIVDLPWNADNDEDDES